MIQLRFAMKIIELNRNSGENGHIEMNRKIISINDREAIESERVFPVLNVGHLRLTFPAVSIVTFLPHDVMKSGS
jgi:hypothetical protein